VNPSIRFMKFLQLYLFSSALIYEKSEAVGIPLEDHGPSYRLEQIFLRGYMNHLVDDLYV
jgi:hypothetical protein